MGTESRVLLNVEASGKYSYHCAYCCSIGRQGVVPTVPCCYGSGEAVSAYNLVKMKHTVVLKVKLSLCTW